MALPGTTIFQMNASAAANLGGGFNPASTGFITDYTATLANTSAPLVSSASYTFLAGDVGHWIYVQSGTNWTAGFYRISAVNIGVATIDATIGLAVQFSGGAWRPSTVVGCATVAIPTGGTIGIDYSQHTSGTVGFALTTLSGAGAGNVVTHATCAQSWVGNIINMVSGTSFTFGVLGSRFEILSVVTGVSFTCGTNYAGASILTGVGTGNGTGNIGGSVVLFEDGFFENAISGNAGIIFYVKAGTYTASGTAMTQAGIGTALSHHKIEGFSVTRGDRPNCINGLSVPLINVGAVTWSAAAQWDFRNISITGTAAITFTAATENRIIDCKFNNTSSGLTRCALFPAGNGILVYRCEITSIRGPAVQTGSNRVLFKKCYFHNSDYGVYINATSAEIHISECIFDTCKTAAIHSAGGNGSLCVFENNTLYGAENCMGIGINLSVVNTRSVVILNNTISGFVTGINGTDVIPTATLAGNTFISNYNNLYNNTTNRTNCPVGENDISVNPTFASVNQILGTIASVSTTTITDTSKDFTALGVVAGRDSFWLKSGSGALSYVFYNIESVGTTTLTIDSSPGTNVTADHLYQITIGRNFQIGTNLRATAAPVKFPGGYTSSYVDIGAAQRQETTSTDPGIANVKISTGYTINDVSLTGSYTGSDRWSDPGAANVLSGTSYLVNAVTTTGTLPSGLTYTDPGISHVLLGTQYTYASVTLTGSLVVPTPASGTSGSVDISNIKETIRFIINAANTTTGSPIDLSNNLTTRVKQVMKINPEKIRVDVNSYPCVTVFTNKKTIEMKTIAKDQVFGKRKCELVFTIVGIVWNDLTSDYKEDGSDEDVEILMENIEVILRSYANLSSTVTWQFPTGVQYHSVPYSEDTHMRVGVMDLQATIYY